MAEIMIVVNIIVGLSYGLLALFFAKRLTLPNDFRRGWRTIVALIFASIFFIGCAHTHFDIAYFIYAGEATEHWLDPFNVVSHIAQAIGGIGFWLFATLWVKINIYDKKDYEERAAQVHREAYVWSHINTSNVDEFE